MSETPLLSDSWLRRAQRLNPYYQQRLGWSVPDGWPTDVAGEDFAESVAFFQKEHGALTVDGIVGPKTAAAFRGLKAEAARWRVPHRRRPAGAGALPGGHLGRA